MFFVFKTLVKTRIEFQLTVSFVLKLEIYIRNDYLKEFVMELVCNGLRRSYLHIILIILLISVCYERVISRVIYHRK